jgi:hypothetical protein
MYKEKSFYVYEYVFNKQIKISFIYLYILICNQIVMYKDWREGGGRHNVSYEKKNISELKKI